MIKLIFGLIFILLNNVAFAQKDTLQPISHLDSNESYSPQTRTAYFPNKKIIIKDDDSIFIGNKLVFSKVNYPAGFDRCLSECFGDKYIILSFGGQGLKWLSQTYEYRRNYVAIIAIKNPVTVHYVNLNGKRLVYEKAALKYMTQDNDHGYVIEDIDLITKTLSLSDYLGQKIIIPFLISFSPVKANEPL